MTSTHQCNHQPQTAPPDGTDEQNTKWHNVRSAERTDDHGPLAAGHKGGVTAVYMPPGIPGPGNRLIFRNEEIKQQPK